MAGCNERGHAKPSFDGEVLEQVSHGYVEAFGPDGVLVHFMVKPRHPSKFDAWPPTFEWVSLESQRVQFTGPTTAILPPGFVVEAGEGENGQDEVYYYEDDRYAASSKHIPSSQAKRTREEHTAKQSTLKQKPSLTSTPSLPLPFVSVASVSSAVQRKTAPIYCSATLRDATPHIT